MLACDRWRNWYPTDGKFVDSPEGEPAKPSEPTFEGFEGATLDRMSNFPPAFPDHDPAEWQEDFTRWRATNCAHRDGKDDWGGVGQLLVDFAEWCVARNAVPCRRATFERLLWDAGFRCAQGMVSGLVLRADLEAVLCYQAAPEGSGRPTQAIVPKWGNVSGETQARKSLIEAENTNPQNPQNGPESPENPPQFPKAMELCL
jgi:hypothetical protein